MSIDWLLTKIGSSKTRKDAVEDTGEGIGPEKENNLQSKETDNHTTDGDAQTQHAREHSHCDSENQGCVSLDTAASKSSGKDKSSTTHPEYPNRGRNPQ